MTQQRPAIARATNGANHERKWCSSQRTGPSCANRARQGSSSNDNSEANPIGCFEGRAGLSGGGRLSSALANTLAPAIDVSGFADLLEFRRDSAEKALQRMRLDATRAAGFAKEENSVPLHSS